MMTEIDEKLIRSYLLGGLSSEERTRFEERLLADDAYFQQLLCVEEDLIDDYLAGKLTAQERAQFDAGFLNAPERRQDLRFAKAFKQYVAASAVKRRPATAPTWFSSFQS